MKILYVNSPMFTLLCSIIDKEENKELITSSTMEYVRCTCDSETIN